MQVGYGKATNRDESHDRRTDPPSSEEATTRLGSRYTVQEAAEILGTTIDGVRGRIRRGTLDSMKVDGVVYVLLDEASRDRHGDRTTSRIGEPSLDQSTNPHQSELVGELRDQVGWLRREVERKDTIIMSLTQRVPELEAPSGTRDAPEPGSEGANGYVPPEPQEPTRRRSWLRRFFGFE
jgi:hypothetical protein